jgi:hypothetical protein
MIFVSFLSTYHSFLFACLYHDFVGQMASHSQLKIRSEWRRRSWLDSSDTEIFSPLSDNLIIILSRLVAGGYTTLSTSKQS